MESKKYEIPEPLMQFFQLVQLSRKDEPKQGHNIPYKDLAVVLEKETGQGEKASGFVITEGIRMCDEHGIESQPHQKTHWFFESFDDAHSHYIKK